MELIFVRHAKAGDREDFRKTEIPDELRPLTKKGIKEFSKVSKSLKKLYPKVDLILSSDLTRALETADLIKLRYPKAKLRVDEALRPGYGSQRFKRWLSRLKRNQNIVLVGHEPDLSVNMNYLLTGGAGIIFDMRKGSFAVLKHEKSASEGAYKLKTFIPPSTLQSLE